MWPGKTPLIEKVKATVKNVLQRLVVNIISTPCSRLFADTYKSSNRQKTDNEIAKGEAHYTF